jgi:hypothetical protein
MAKSKKKLEIEFIPEVITPEEKDEIEVIGVTEAEKLQKSGWQLIDCHQTPDGKVYKFKKGNK